MNKKRIFIEGTLFKNRYNLVRDGEVLFQMSEEELRELLASGYMRLKK